MKNLLIYLKKYRKESILAPLFKVLEVAFDLLVPVVVADMINVGVKNGDKAYMVRCALILLGMAALGLGCTVAAQFFAAKASVGFAASLRQATFDQGRLDRVTRLTRENLTGVRVIRAFCREEHSVTEFEESNNALTKLNEFVGKILALLNPLTYVLINIGAVFLIDRAAVHVNVGALEQGYVIALYNYMLQIIVEHITEI